MKKLFLGLFLAGLSVSTFAVDAKLMAISSATSTSGGLTITANMTNVSNRKVVVYNVIGRSDLSTSILTLQEADAAGTPSTYTALARFDVGAATRQYNNSGAPLFVGKPGYAYRFLVNSTAANSVIVTYSYE